MALNARQRHLYVDRIDVWRRAEQVDPVTGKPGDGTWSRVLRDLPCKLDLGQSSQAPAGGFVFSEGDNMFTLDELHTEAGVDLRVGDAVRRGGDWWIVRGDPQAFARLGNKQTLNVSRTPGRPAGIPA